MELNSIQTVACHDDKVWTLAWHQSSQFVATASSDKLIKIWGVQNGQSSNELELKATLEGAHTRTIRSLAWKPDC